MSPPLGSPMAGRARWVIIGLLLLCFVGGAVAWRFCGGGSAPPRERSTTGAPEPGPRPPLAPDAGLTPPPRPR